MRRWICRGSRFWDQAPRKVYSAQIHQIYPLVQKVCLISMNSWILMYKWEMVMQIWEFSLERLVATWDLLYKSDLHKYSVGIFIIDTSYWITSFISSHMAKVFCGIWLRACIGWCIERSNIIKGLKSRSCEGYHTYSWLHTLMAHD
jgi:hypothetical protein